MPIWQVREAQVDYRLFDTPLKYTPAYGPPVSLDLVYQTWRATDYNYYPANDANPLFGPQWHCAWSSDLVISNFVNGAFQTYWNYLGGRLIYTNFSGNPLVSAPAYEDGSRLQIVTNGSGAAIGGRIYKRDGSIVEYFQAYSSTQFLLTTSTDANGKALSFSYDGSGRLNQITAATGETTSFVYGHSSNNRLVTQVNAPGGYTANFAYGYVESGESGQWQLTNITDTVGITSTFTYRTEDNGSGSFRPLETLNTPYGTTRFAYLQAPTNLFGRTLLITEPNGGQHLYLQMDPADDPLSFTNPLPSSFDSAVIPDGLPLRNARYFAPGSQYISLGPVAVSWHWKHRRAQLDRAGVQARPHSPLVGQNRRLGRAQAHQ
jgi:YD repeat-containing protein